MPKYVLMSWKEECDVIHREMDRLLAAGWLETAEERQVRKMQFMALIERRNVAAQNFLKSDADTANFSIDRQVPSQTFGGLPDTGPTPKVETADAKMSHEPPDAGRMTDQNPQIRIMSVQVSQKPSEAMERDSQERPSVSTAQVETMNVNMPQAPSEAAFTPVPSFPAPPAEPIFEVRNFLKRLGLT
jgi:uncharacterized protein YneF (UPF0154 family)